ncbi:ABC transporter ATP-binding protein [Paenibacillus graminis]|uniref:ABC transporter ATP-binding protein n=1 Tax=Paenibacillus graminis TaxID=189425 RepID=UPI000470DB60|nr:ABC transporter ATP-binding protein [Paenibacillus graminis]
MLKQSENKAGSSWKVLISLLQINRKLWPQYVFLIICIILAAGIDVAGTEVFRRMISAATARNMEALRESLLLAGGIIAGTVILGSCASLLTEFVNYKSSVHLESLMVQKLLHINIAYHKNYHSGDLVKRVSDNARNGQIALNNNLMDGFRVFAVIVLNLVYLSAINSLFTVSCLVVALLLPFALKYLSRKLNVIYGRKLNAESALNAFTQECIDGAEVVRTTSLGERTDSIFHSKYAEFMKWAKKGIWFESLTNQVNFFIRIGGMIFIIGYGGVLVKQEIIGVSSVVAFILVFWRMLNPISNAMVMWPKFQNSLSQLSRALEIFEIEEERGIPNGNEILSRNNSEPEMVQFSNVSFAYSPGRVVLDTISFTVKAGTVTAIVGPSGSGKSTILQLLLGFLQPVSGEIRIGSALQAEHDILQWRSDIAYISQEMYVFSGTFFENIALGKLDATLGEVMDAAQKVNMHDMIMSTPEGYGTLIGEGGLTLSGGECQRISIARALMKQASIFVMDEPTSALDGENEAAIFREFKNMIKSKTLIIVSHKPLRLEQVDQYLYLDHGQIVEQGTYEQLIARKGKYYNLLNGYAEEHDIA